MTTRDKRVAQLEFDLRMLMVDERVFKFKRDIYRDNLKVTRASIRKVKEALQRAKSDKAD